MSNHETARTIVTGTTRGLPPGTDYEAFCDGVTDVYVGVRPERPAQGRFAADFALYDLAPMSLGIISTPGVDAHRDRRSLSVTADDAVFVNHSRRAWALGQHGDRWQVAPGAAAVLDNGAAFSVMADPRHRLDLVSLRIPREELSRETARGLRMLNDTLAATARGARLGAQIALLADAVRDGMPTVARAMASAVVEMLDAFGAGSEADPPPRVEALRAHARAHLHDPAFDLTALARAFSCTPRTVQADFARDGSAFGRWLRDERLTAARETLRRGDPRPLDAIARAHGFADVGTFHRAYRARFGRTPGSDR